MKTIWLLVMAIAIIVKGNGDGNTINSNDNLDQTEHAKADNVSQVTDTAVVQTKSNSNSIEPPIPDQMEVDPAKSPSMRSLEAEGNGSGLIQKVTPSETIETIPESTSNSLASVPNSNVDSVGTSTTLSPPSPTTSPTTTATTTTTTESSSSKKPNCCCCCRDCAEGAVTPTKDGEIVANGTKDGNISMKGINKSRVIAILVITVGFLAVVTFVTCCYKRRGDISMKVRTWSIRARQFDFNSLRPVCLRWKKPNCESSPILVFKVDETELDVLTENMV